jgi:hypothetical protein
MALMHRYKLGGWQPELLEIRDMLRITTVLEQTNEHAIVELNNGLRAELIFDKPISDHAVLHWNGLTLDEVNTIVTFHNEKGFY